MIYSTFGNVRESTDPKTYNISTLTDNGNVLANTPKASIIFNDFYSFIVPLFILFIRSLVIGPVATRISHAQLPFSVRTIYRLRCHRRRRRRRRRHRVEKNS